MRRALRGGRRRHKDIEDGQQAPYLSTMTGRALLAEPRPSPAPAETLGRHRRFYPTPAGHDDARLGFVNSVLRRRGRSRRTAARAAIRSARRLGGVELERT